MSLGIHAGFSFGGFFDLEKCPVSGACVMGITLSHFHVLKMRYYQNRECTIIGLERSGLMGQELHPPSCPIAL